MAWFGGRGRSSSDPDASDGAEQPTGGAAADLPLETLIAQGMSTIRATTAVYAELFGMDKASWAVDLSAGEITFTSPDRKAVAAVQVVGTYDPAAGTWLWGWDHPSVPAPCAVGATRVRDLGAARGLVQLTTREVTCTADDAWGFAALAVRLGPETCAYRGPAGGPLVFMTFGEVTVSLR